LDVAEAHFCYLNAAAAFEYDLNAFEITSYKIGYAQSKKSELPEL
jgi:hypothetical protein